MSDARTSKDQLSVLLDRFRNRLGEHWGRSHTEAVFNEAIRLKGERDDYAAKYDKWMQRALKTEGSTHEPPAVRRWDIRPAFGDGVDFLVDKAGEWVKWEDVAPHLRASQPPPAAPARTLIENLHGYVTATSDQMGYAKALQAIELALGRAPSPPVVKCDWGYDAGDDVWHTDCGELHVFMEGSPTSNGYKYCPYCRKDIDDLSQPTSTKAPEHCTACGEPHGGKCPYSSGGEEVR